MSELVAEVRLRSTGELRRFEKVQGLSDLTQRALQAWGFTMKFVFETSTHERAHVDSDIALRVAANAHGTLYAEEYDGKDDEQLLSVSACLRNVLAAALNTNNNVSVNATNSNANIRRPSTPPSPPLVASLFNTPITPITATPPISSIPSSPPTTRARARSPSPISPLSRNIRMKTPPLSPPTSRPRSPVLNTQMGMGTGPTSISGAINGNPNGSGSALTPEGRFAEYYFCTHRGVECVSCSTRPICGTRYLSTEDSGSLCETCRQSRSGRASSCCYMVYDHPWESCQEYEHVAELRAPPAPLFFGDIGPKVIHLHFTLYTLGYLFLLAPGFVADTFNSVTSEAIQKFQSDFNFDSDDDSRVYSNRMRGSMLRRIEQIEQSMRNRNRSSSPCRRNTQGNSSRLRLRSALAA